jgi:hypothetical protein
MRGRCTGWTLDLNEHPFGVITPIGVNNKKEACYVERKAD